MIAIETRYLGPTNYRPSRIVASTCNGHRIVVSYDHGAPDPHEVAARALIEQEGWSGVWTKGSTRDGSVWVRQGGDRIHVARQSDAA
jgi:hypothetical protein